MLNYTKTIRQLNQNFSSTSWQGATFSLLDTKATAFETANGESVVAYYNPRCITEFRTLEQLSELGHPINLAQTVMCVNFVYDLNGKKGPNTVGKDIGFITAFNATDSIVVAPHPVYKIINNGSAVNYNTAVSSCKSDEMRLANIDELSALSLNGVVSGLTFDLDIWSGTKASANQAWVQDTALEVRYIANTDETYAVLCIKRE